MEGNPPEELLQMAIKESKEKGIENGILLCDYGVTWVPFGRYIASCEGGYFITFYGKISP